MDLYTAKKLNELNQEFYLKQADVFSSTRQSPWTGWTRCMEVAEQWQREQFPPTQSITHSKTSHNNSILNNHSDHSSYNNKTYKDSMCNNASMLVLDVAAGNLRFEKWLQERWPHTSIHFTVLDNCKNLLPDTQNDIHGVHTSFFQVDLIDKLLNEGSNFSLFPENCNNTFRYHLPDITVCFGFMHHVPGNTQRRNMLEALLNHSKKGSLIMVSFWCFTRDHRLKMKAVKTTESALKHHPNLQLEANDFLLDFNNDNTYRYCHSYTSKEVDKLMTDISHSSTIIDRFSADGRNNCLNEYAILQRL